MESYEIVQTLIDAAGISQADLCRASGQSPAFVSRQLSGERGLTDALVLAAAVLLTDREAERQTMRRARAVLADA